MCRRVAGIRQVTAEDFDARIRLGRPFIIADAGLLSCSHIVQSLPGIACAVV